MFFSVSKIFWLLVILAIVWYIFKFIEKKKSNSKTDSVKQDDNKKNLDAFQCSFCGLWSTNKSCNNKNCSSNL